MKTRSPAIPLIRTSPTAKDYILALILSLLCSLLLQAAQARIDLNLGDEGMLWYGVQRTCAGELPIRDFQSYDPARYFLWATWFHLFHSDGVICLRLGIALIHWAALFPALLLIRRANISRWMLPFLGILLALWMGPRHKMIDVAAAVWMTCMLARLISRPTAVNHLLVGAMIGLLWFIGMNHAVYAFAAAGMVVLAVAWTQRTNDEASALSAFVVNPLCTMIGIAAGSLPMIVMLVFVPHYGIAYWKNEIQPLIHMHSTNLQLPIPWPWTIQTPWLTPLGVVSHFTGIGFLIFPIAVVLSAGILVYHASRKRLLQYPILLASTATAAVWMHHAFARADLPHLAQGGVPMGLILITLPQAISPSFRGCARCITWSAFTAISLLAMAKLSPAVNMRLQPSANYGWKAVGPEKLWLPQMTANICQAAQDVSRQLQPNETALFIPYVPGLYAQLRLRCPIPECYPLFPATEEEQRNIIADLKSQNTGWILYWSDREDGRPDLGFAQTHPLAWKYILENYEAVGALPAANNAMVFRRRSI